MSGLSEVQHSQLAQLLTDVAGLSFLGQRRQALAAGVDVRMRVTGCAQPGDYLQLAADSALERQALLDEVTVQETQFFRNPPQVRALRRYVLPEIVRRATRDGSRRIRIWSAGCSTGEEPYTVAMLLRELVPAGVDGWDIQIIGTDVSTRAVQGAQRATYGLRSVRLVDDVDRDRWLVRVPGDLAEYAVRDEVRDIVDIRHHNVVTDTPPCAPGELDLVLCRNVTIYLTTEATRALVQRFHGCLRDGGYLFLGHAETLWQISDAFTLVPLGDAFVYRRVDAPVDRRQVLPDRRGGQDPWLSPERRHRERRRGERRAVAVATPDTDTLLGPARAALSEGRYDDAAQLADQVAQARPLDAVSHYLRGLALATAGADAEAVVSLRKALYLDPGNGLAHFVLAGALARLRQGAAAAQAYRAAAHALGARPPLECVDELGGRRAEELAALSLRLAAQAEQAS